MKIYMVVAVERRFDEADNYWNVDAFTSEEAAREHIKKLPYEIFSKNQRIDELERLAMLRKLTPEEESEWRELNNKWSRLRYAFGEDDFYIEEFDVLS